MGQNQDITITHITPHQSQLDYWRKLWEYRELILFLSRRDLLVKYRQTAAGLLWLILRPAVQVFMFSVVFGEIAGLPSAGLPYTIIALSGVTIWTLFNSIVSHGSICLISNQSLITKVQFPRILLPIATIPANLVDLTVVCLGLGGLMIYHDLTPSWRLMLIPIPITLTVLIALGISLFTSAGSVRYRDLHQIIPFGLQTLLFLTPVGYLTDAASNELPQAMSALYHLNPLVSAIDLFRWTILPTGFGPPQNLTLLTISLTSATLLLVIGQWYFRKSERTFADVI